MKKEIIVISDLWGKSKSNWFDKYVEKLGDNYTLKYYDACLLGEVETEPYEQDQLHHQFVQFGINNAIDNLLELEKSNRIYIGCSVGGVIAWKAGLKGLPIEKLITISSTRLRKESKAPNCQLYNFFGNNDVHKPNSEWLNSSIYGATFIIDGSHDIYKKCISIDYIIHQTKLQ